MLVPPSLELVGLFVLSLVDVLYVQTNLGMRVLFIRKKCCVPVHLQCTAVSFNCMWFLPC